jgi:hypothetical protein
LNFGTMLRFYGKHSLIDTPLQRGGAAHGQDLNRFSGFRLPKERRVRLETAKAVASLTAPTFTPLKLKRGINDRVCRGDRILILIPHYHY